MVKHLTLFFFLFIIFTSCTKEKPQFTISGVVKNMPAQLVSLEKIGVGENAVIDTLTTKADGKFVLHGERGEPGLYVINIDNQKMHVIIDKENITLNANWSDLSQYKVENSPATLALQNFNKEYFKLNQNMVALKLVMDSLTDNNASDSLKLELQRKGDAQERSITDYVKKVADESKSMPLIYYVTSLYLDPYDDAEYFKDLATNLTKKFPNQKFAKDFSDLIQRKQKEESAKPAGPKIGDSAIDFTIKNERGKLITLSSFYGQYILLDFWASWCPPCRGQNIYVVHAYNKFKNRDFTVVSVSLDENQEDWLKAIKDDRLTWTNLSELRKWKSDLNKTYHVRSIPTNYLINPEGKIIARDLVGDDLITFLDKALPKY